MLGIGKGSPQHDNPRATVVSRSRPFPYMGWFSLGLRKKKSKEGDQGMLSGGYGEDEPATAETQEMLDKVSEIRSYKKTRLDT